MSPPDLSQLSMYELFRMEAEEQRHVLTEGLLVLERGTSSVEALESCMRAAHSLKGAAAIVGLGAAVSIAHGMEDCFVAVQEGRVAMSKKLVDRLLEGIDLLLRIAGTPENQAAGWAASDAPEAASFRAQLEQAQGSLTAFPSPHEAAEKLPMAPLEAGSEETAPVAGEPRDRVLRVTAENLNRLLSLSGESLVESRALKPFAESLGRLRRMQHTARKSLDRASALRASTSDAESLDAALSDTAAQLSRCEHFLSERLVELDRFERHSASIAHRLYDEALACRMRPFADGLQAFPRIVRDLAHALGKSARLEIVGEDVQVDRDVLEKLEAPISHLLRNALDHGLESPDERRAAGKPSEGVISLEARHSAGMLQISVCDDGRGIGLEQVRERVVRRGLVAEDVATKLSDAELFEFLFLPGFTVKDSVTDISGRGVGLDAVQNMARGLEGGIRVSSTVGQGARFVLQLPLTVSVVRTLLVDIGGEPYAFPLAALASAVSVPRDRVEVAAGRQHFDFRGQVAALVSAEQIFERAAGPRIGAELAVVVIAHASGVYGLVVDRFIGVRELVVQPLDPWIGKVNDVSAGAILEDGSPVLIANVDDLIRSIEKLISSGHLGRIQDEAGTEVLAQKRRVLIVDDSLTVREIERKLIESGGYEVEVAVDGADGWNAVRRGKFDLVVTDIDMPRMDGIELLKLIRSDPRLRSMRVMIVSYKDRAEDRRRGLEAGANFYLTKGSFHDEALLQAVVDLVGNADGKAET